MITQATATKPAVEEKTCSTCPNFNNHLYSAPKGWCELFNLPAKTHHIQTNNCVISSDIPISHELEDNLAFFTNIDLDPFPTEVIELDRDGYPMGKETVENGYFDDNFVTYPNEPF